jgi:hypothetical protein
MTVFIRLVSENEKSGPLLASCSAIRNGSGDDAIYTIDPSEFSKIPGAPFAYWAPSKLRKLFMNLPPFEGSSRSARVGLQTSDDYRFVRLWWETKESSSTKKWFSFARGGSASKFYGNLNLQLHWKNDGEELKAWAEIVNNGGHWSRNIRSPDFYLKPGITWPLRAAEFSPYPLPSDSVFSIRGAVAFTERNHLLALLGLMSSHLFDYIYKLLLGRFGHPEFSIGALQKVPICPDPPSKLAELADRSWRLKRRLHASEETGHAFVLPSSLLARTDVVDPTEVASEIESLQEQIDAISIEKYGLTETDTKTLFLTTGDIENEDVSEAADDIVEDFQSREMDATLSWSVGVSFGRFDWRLATGEREAPGEPDPFDPLPAKSPGMLPDGAEPFHAHFGILVDDPGHPQDLSRLIEDILATVDSPAPRDVRRWLRRDFFPHHLKQYSKSGRKAPIYWPLSTASGGYTLWLYYPAVTDQTLYTAANDFVGPKLEATSRLIADLRTRTDRSRDEERQLEQLQDLEAELKELQDELLRLAPTWKPNHDDGVQITATPLWRLFRHRSWQTVLKETWEKLEKGDYDWSHLAMSYWPDRVRKKCRTEKSLAIAHNLEQLYEPPPEKPGTSRRGHKGRADAW